MGKKRNSRLYRVLYAIAIAIIVIAWAFIICSVLLIVNGGRMWAILPLAASIGILWFGDELAEATNKRNKH